MADEKRLTLLGKLVIFAFIAVCVGFALKSAARGNVPIGRWGFPLYNKLSIFSEVLPLLALKSSGT